MKWAYGVFVILLILQTFAWILEKKGIMQITADNHLTNIELIRRAITNPYLMIGITCAGLGFICWLYLLSQFNLSYIYPFGSVLYIVVTICAYFIFGEALTVNRILGILVITTGCVLINL